MLKLLENLTSIITLNNQLIIKNFSLPLVKGSFCVYEDYWKGGIHKSEMVKIQDAYF